MLPDKKLSPAALAVDDGRTEVLPSIFGKYRQLSRLTNGRRGWWRLPLASSMRTTNHGVGHFQRKTGEVVGQKQPFAGVFCK